MLELLVHSILFSSIKYKENQLLILVLNIVYVGTGGTSTISGGSIQYVQDSTDGLHFRVKHNNHGMYHNYDTVELFDIESDVKPEKLTASYDSSSTDSIPVSVVGIFTNFENVNVDSSNFGYVKIGSEIIRYSGSCYFLV